MKVNEEPASPNRILPPVYVFAAVVLMTCLHLLLPVVQFVQAPYNYFGILLVVGAFATIVWVAVVFHRAGTTIRPFERSSALLVDGLYGLTRNPIYASMAVGLVGFAVLFGSLSPFLVVPIFVYVIDRRFVQAEEALLEQTFGAQYSAYKEQVRRWV